MTGVYSNVVLVMLVGVLMNGRSVPRIKGICDAALASVSPTEAWSPHVAPFRSLVNVDFSAKANASVLDAAPPASMES